MSCYLISDHRDATILSFLQRYCNFIFCYSGVVILFLEYGVGENLFWAILVFQFHFFFTKVLRSYFLLQRSFNCILNTKALQFSFWLWIFNSKFLRSCNFIILRICCNCFSFIREELKFYSSLRSAISFAYRGVAISFIFSLCYNIMFNFRRDAISSISEMCCKLSFDYRSIDN